MTSSWSFILQLSSDDKLDSDFRKQSVIKPQTKVPKLRSEMQLPGFTEDEAMVSIEVFRIQLYFYCHRSRVRGVQDSQKRNKFDVASRDRANA